MHTTVFLIELTYMPKILILIFACLVSFSLAAQTDLYNPEKIQEIRISFDDPNWFQTLHEYKEEGNEKRLEATLVLNGTSYEGVGVRFKGNSSYYNVRKTGATKLPFNIKANFTEKGQRFPDDIKTLKLSNVFRDPSFLREVLSYEIAAKYMPSPRAGFSRVYVNDEYLGLYNLTESVDENFLEDHFGENQGTFVKCDPAWGAKEKDYCPEGDKASLMYQGDNPNCYFTYYEMKSDSGWTELIDLTKVLTNEPERIEEILDVDMALWMLAFNNVLVNLDSYTGRLCHNYYLYRLENGRFVPIVWDMNLSFGGFKFAGLDKGLSVEEMQTMSPFIHYKQKNNKRPLITTLLSDPLYRRIYLGHVRTILNENFVNGEYLERAKKLMEIIDEEVKNDKNKLYTYEGFQNNLYETAPAGKVPIVGLEELMGPRIEYLQNHPTLKDGGPTIQKVEALEFGPTLAIQATIEGATEAYLAYRYDPSEAFKRIEMFDDSGHNDEMADDNIWGATLEATKGLQYYVIGADDRLANFSPERASFEYYTFE
jgi:hypothetical protein